MKALYNQNLFANYSAEPKIPKIFHNLYYGNDSMKNPVFQTFYEESCRKLHPDWTFMHWGKEEIEELPYNKDLLEELLSERGDYAKVKDYIALEVLIKYGGVFVDMDLFCLKPLDELHHRYSYYAVTHPYANSRSPIINAGLIAAAKNSSLLIQ